VARELTQASRHTVIGVEILLNDPEASLAVALASEARFIRTDYFVDPMERPEHGGEMKIDPHGLLAYRERISARVVLIFADIQVKYARMLEERSLAESARLAKQHGADAIVVTGRVTGEPPLRTELEEASRGAGGCPILIGSGLDATNARELLSVADGAIVGSSLKTGEYVDAAKVIALKESVRSL
jgi:membrane complex biogenesis BtpA family protein